MIIDTITMIEEARMFSKLSDRLYHFENDGKRYTSFSDLIVPYNVGAIMIVWALTKSSIYHGLLESCLDKDCIRALNPENEYLRDPTIKIPMFMYNKLISIMETWEPNQFDDVIPGFA